MEKAFDNIIKYGLYALVFFLPLWFLPLTISPLNINKQMFLAAFVFLSLILWVVQIFISGKTRFINNKLNFAVIFFIAVVSLSAFFSSSTPQSFWGMNFEYDTLFGFVLYGILFFLFANLVKKEDISKILWSFVFSGVIFSLLFFVQLFKPVFPIDSIGSMSSLAIFLAAVVSVIVARSNNNYWFLVISPLAVLFLINYWQAWLMVAIAMAVVVFIKLKNSAHSSDNPLKPVFLSLFILLLVVTFIFLKLPVEKIVSLPQEFTSTYSATIDIAVKTLKSGAKNLIIGSGPATFAYQYGLNREAVSNAGDFWQIRFNQGAAAAPTFLTTLGILGVLSFLFIIILFLWQAIKKIGEMGPEVLIMGLIFIISLFLFPADIVVLAFAFLALGLWVSAGAKEEEYGEKELFSSQSPQKTFLIMGLCFILMVCSIWTLYNFSQKYAGAIIYAKGVNLVNSENPKLDEGIAKIDNAAFLDKKDIYFRNLSQAVILKINEVLNNPALPDEQKKTTLQKLVSGAETTASAAAGINPANSQNWLQLGSVYENFTVLNIEGAENLAVLNYQKAFELDPQNPQIPFNIARAYISAAKKVKTKGGEYKNYLDLALENSQKAVDLKSDFSPAYSLMEEIQKMR